MAEAEGSATGTRTGLLERLDRLARTLARAPTATGALRRWCAARNIGAGPVTAERLLGARGRPLDPARRARLAPTPGLVIRHRRVRLLRGGVALSEAETWFLPGRLPPAVRARLEASAVPFGAAVTGCRPRRCTLTLRPLALPEGRRPAPDAPVLEIEALVLDGAGRPLALVRERYLAVLIL